MLFGFVAATVAGFMATAVPSWTGSRGFAGPLLILLGHTGSPLHAPPPIAWAYGMLILAAIVRVFGPALFPAAYRTSILLAMLLWVGAFLLFAIVYTPILVRPRAVGTPG